jgi:hypothetical protein
LRCRHFSAPNQLEVVVLWGSDRSGLLVSAQRSRASRLKAKPGHENSFRSDLQDEGPQTGPCEVRSESRNERRSFVSYCLRALLSILSSYIWPLGRVAPTRFLPQALHATHTGASNNPSIGSTNDAIRWLGLDLILTVAQLHSTRTGTALTYTLKRRRGVLKGYS